MPQDCYINWKRDSYGRDIYWPTVIKCYYTGLHSLLKDPLKATGTLLIPITTSIAKLYLAANFLVTFTIFFQSNPFPFLKSIMFYSFSKIKDGMSSATLNEPDVLTEVPEALKRLVRYITRGFYSIEHAIIVDMLVHHPCVKEDDLCDLIKFERKVIKGFDEYLEK